MSYQPEERYWADYLRIALPIVGLLLLVGLFWYWAAQFIGDPANTEPSPPATQANVAVINAATPTVVVAPTAVINAEQGTLAPTAPASTDTPGGDPTAAPTTQVEPPPADDPPATGQITNGSTVVTNDDGVNLRDAPSVTGAVVDVLSMDILLTVTGEMTQADNYDWWPVRTPGGQEGYVAADFIAPAP